MSPLVFIFPTRTIFIIFCLMSTQMQGWHKVSSPGPKAPNLGDKYSSLVAANPYRNQAYNKSPWQNFLTSLGIRTQADAWQENMNVQAAEYDAALAQKAYNEKFESPAAEAARMREAGLNSDLQGIGDVAGASPMGEDPSTPMQSSGDEGMLMTVANGVLNAFTTAVGVVGSIQNIATTGLSNLGKVTELAESQFPNLIPFLGESQDYSRPEIIDSSMAMARMFAKQNLPRRYRNRFQNTILGFWNSAPGDAKAYKEWSDRITSRRGYAINSKTLYDEFSEVLYPMAQELADMQSDIYRARQQADLTDATADTAENENRQEYATALDSELQAQTENAQNSVSYQNAQMVDIMRQHLKKMVDTLESASKEKGIKGALASVAMSMISMLQLWISTQGAPSISRSSSFNSGTQNFGADSYSKGSSSFSIGF